MTMINAPTATAIAVMLSYLIGSIPFGLIVTYWKAGIDIRTVGSGNIGATNVKRVLGTKFFLLVMLLDACKAMVPVLVFPVVFARWLGEPLPDLGVLAALAAILGHNFSIYLRFHGGKGVAASLGAAIGLYPLGSLIAVGAFILFLVFFRYMSLACNLAALAFAGAWFLRTPAPFERESIAMSLFVIIGVSMMLIRHRKNFARILAGTEPDFWEKRRMRTVESAKPARDEPARPSPNPSENGNGRAGKASEGLILILAGLAVILGGALGVGLIAVRPNMLMKDGYDFQVVARITTGQQRAERLAFVRTDAHGTTPSRLVMATTCPRYNGVALHDVTQPLSPKPITVVKLEGRPTAIRAVPGTDAFLVLQYPGQDARHLQPGWWDAVSPSGEVLSDQRLICGYYPDDLCVRADGAWAFVLVSEQAEGDEHLPPPAVLAVDLRQGLNHARIVGRWNVPPREGSQKERDKAYFDPVGLALSPDGTHLAVALAKSGGIHWLDVSKPEQPIHRGRTAFRQPAAIAYDYANQLVVADHLEGLWRIASPVTEAVELPITGPVADLLPLPGKDHPWLMTLELQSGLALADPSATDYLGILSLRGAANLSGVKPLGMAYDPVSGLLGVANQSGGTVHLIQCRLP